MRSKDGSLAKDITVYLPRKINSFVRVSVDNDIINSFVLNNLLILLRDMGIQKIMSFTIVDCVIIHRNPEYWIFSGQVLNFASSYSFHGLGKIQRGAMCQLWCDSLSCGGVVKQRLWQTIIQRLVEYNTYEFRTKLSKLKFMLSFVLQEEATQLKLQTEAKKAEQEKANKIIERLQAI